MDFRDHCTVCLCGFTPVDLLRMKDHYRAHCYLVPILHRLVAFLTWRDTKHDLATDEGYFLAGRSLTGVFIAGSLLLTNLSTEQLVGLNGDSFNDGLSVMCWEVVAGASW